MAMTSDHSCPFLEIRLPSERWEVRDEAVSLSLNDNSHALGPCRVLQSLPRMKTGKQDLRQGNWKRSINMAQKRLWGGNYSVPYIPGSWVKVCQGHVWLAEPGTHHMSWLYRELGKRMSNISHFCSWEWSLAPVTLIIWEFPNQSKTLRCWIDKTNDKHPLFFLLLNSEWENPKAKTRVRS